MMWDWTEIDINLFLSLIGFCTFWIVYTFWNVQCSIRPAATTEAASTTLVCCLRPGVGRRWNSMTSMTSLCVGRSPGLKESLAVKMTSLRVFWPLERSLKDMRDRSDAKIWNRTNVIFRIFQQHKSFFCLFGLWADVYTHAVFTEYDWAKRTAVIEDIL